MWLRNEDAAELALNIREVIEDSKLAPARPIRALKALREIIEP